VITDLFQNRLDIAKKLVPNARTCLVERGDTPEQIAEKIKAKAGVEIKLALECTGVESSIRAAIFVGWTVFEGD
jgi:L-iditol 2-dehydrogenase